MIWIIAIIGIWSVAFGVSHIYWRQEFNRRLSEFDCKADEGIYQEKHLEFPKSEHSRESWSRYLMSFSGLPFGDGANPKDEYFFKKPVSEVVEDLMRHTGMEYEYHDSQPERITIKKKRRAKRK